MDSLKKLKEEALLRLKKIVSEAELDEFELSLFGRKQGKLTEILRSLSEMTEDERRVIGAQANELRRDLEGRITNLRRDLTSKNLEHKLKREKIDVTLPGRAPESGSLNPLTQIRREAENIFRSLGFAVVEGPEIESDFYNFTSLNIPPDHPAREMQATFWVDTPKAWKEPYLLRTHVSNVQVRFMREHNPPFRIVYFGKVFRYEATDASHDFQFNQIECLMVGKDISVANLKYLLGTFFERMFGKGTNIRLRPSFFSFVEPGFEVDITCVACRGKGCSVCKQSGWVELLGAGMVHQNVFKAAGYAKGEYQGLAFGIGLDRIAMMKYHIPDIRLFRSNDIRFLSQF